MSLRPSIFRVVVLRYVAGGLSLRQLEAWFAPRAWDLDPSNGEYRFVSAVMGLLTVADEWPEDQLREKLRLEAMQTMGPPHRPIRMRVSGSRPGSQAFDSNAWTQVIA